MMDGLKLDLGCGSKKKEGFIGVDNISFPDVDMVFDLRNAPWPWEDSSVSEIHMAHLLEHFTKEQRVSVVNEMYRILVPGGTCQIITPHWNSGRAYGDFTHEWPPVSEFWYLYLHKDWRLREAPHTDISVNPNGFIGDFDHTMAYSLRPDLSVKNSDFQQFAVDNYKEACQDCVANITKKA